MSERPGSAALADGTRIDFDAIPDDAYDWVVENPVQFDPLGEEEAAANPADFVAGVTEALRTAIGQRKGLKARFVASGRFGWVSYWVYEASGYETEGVYGLAIRNNVIFEMTAVDGTGLTPEKAAFLSFWEEDAHVSHEPEGGDSEGSEDDTGSAEAGP